MAKLAFIGFGVPGFPIAAGPACGREIAALDGNEAHASARMKRFGGCTSSLIRRPRR